MAKSRNFEVNCTLVLTRMSKNICYKSTKFIIEKAVKQVFHVYPYFDTDVLSFSNSSIWFLE